MRPNSPRPSFSVVVCLYPAGLCSLFACSPDRPAPPNLLEHPFTLSLPLHSVAQRPLERSFCVPSCLPACSATACPALPHGPRAAPLPSCNPNPAGRTSRLRSPGTTSPPILPTTSRSPQALSRTAVAALRRTPSRARVPAPRPLLPRPPVTLRLTPFYHTPHPSALRPPSPFLVRAAKASKHEAPPARDRHRCRLGVP